VYFIGAGPGDPRYLTIEGHNALKSSQLVYAISPYPETFSDLLTGKTVNDPFDRVFDDIVNEIENALKTGSVSFLIPGDLAVFSPFLPIVEHFGGRSSVIAGVGILNASAALLKRSLDMPGVSHSVVLTSPKHIDKAGDTEELKHLATAAGTLVLYMNNRPLKQLVKEIGRGFPAGTPVAIVSRVGMEGERVYEGTLETINEVVGRADIFGLESGEPSMGIIIIGDVLKTLSDPDFWNKRKKKFWDRNRVEK